MPARTDIRDAYIAIYEAMAGIDTVYRGRRRNVPASAMPAVCVYVGKEEKQPHDIGGANGMERTLSVVSEIHVKGATLEAVEESLDTLCEARETALFADTTLGNTALDVNPESDVYDVSDEGDKPAAEATCTDQVLYFA